MSVAAKVMSRRRDNRNGFVFGRLGALLHANRRRKLSGVQAHKCELSARLLRSSSATRTLQAWCEEQSIAAGPVTALRLQGTRGSKLSKDVLAELRPDPGEPISYRHVCLMRGDTVLCEADNWFMPERLKPGMRHLLEDTNVPFGVVIEPLNPSRRTFFIEFYDTNAHEASISSPAPAASTSQAASAPVLPEVIFEHRAVIVCGEKRPLAVVYERYRSALIATVS